MLESIREYFKYKREPFNKHEQFEFNKEVVETLNHILKQLDPCRTDVTKMDEKFREEFYEKIARLQSRVYNRY